MVFGDSLRSSGVYHPESFRGMKKSVESCMSFIAKIVGGNEGLFRMKCRSDISYCWFAKI